MILKVREDFMVSKQTKQRDFIAKWFTVADFHTLEAMFMYIDHYSGKGSRFVTVLWTRDFLARPILPGNRS